MHIYMLIWIRSHNNVIIVQQIKCIYETDRAKSDTITTICSLVITLSKKFQNGRHFSRWPPLTMQKSSMYLQSNSNHWTDLNDIVCAKHNQS